jgi:hypothetical protein
MIKGSNNTMMKTNQILILKTPHLHSVLFVFVVFLSSPLSVLHYHNAVFANHGQEIFLSSNSAQYLPLSSSEGNQIKVIVNYTTVNSTLLGQTINAVMNIYAPNTTAIRSTSFPNGFTVNNSGIQELKTIITDNQTQNVTAVVQFTDAAKIADMSNPIQAKLNLTRPTLEYIPPEEVIKPEIAALP